jgi:hypothetical protein
MFCSVEQDSGMAFNIYLSCLIIKLVLLTGQGQPSYEVTVLPRLVNLNLSHYKASPLNWVQFC